MIITASFNLPGIPDGSRPGTLRRVFEVGALPVLLRRHAYMAVRR